MADGVSAIDTKRPTRMVVVGYLLSFVAVGIFFENALAALFGAMRWNDVNIGGSDWTISSLIGYGLAAAIAIGCYMHPTVQKLSYEVAVELKKSNFPNGEDTRTSTIAVVLFSLISAGILGIFDFVSSKIMTQWIPTALDAIARHV
jgi:preprotein translocase subunit SecE